MDEPVMLDAGYEVALRLQEDGEDTLRYALEKFPKEDRKRIMKDTK